MRKDTAVAVTVNRKVQEGEASSSRSFKFPEKNSDLEAQILSISSPNNPLLHPEFQYPLLIANGLQDIKKGKQSISGVPQYTLPDLKGFSNLIHLWYEYQDGYRPFNIPSIRELENDFKSHWRKKEEATKMFRRNTIIKRIKHFMEQGLDTYQAVKKVEEEKEKSKCSSISAYVDFLVSGGKKRKDSEFVPNDNFDSTKKQKQVESQPPSQPPVLAVSHGVNVMRKEDEWV